MGQNNSEIVGSCQKQWSLSKYIASLVGFIRVWYVDAPDKILCVVGWSLFQNFWNCMVSPSNFVSFWQNTRFTKYGIYCAIFRGASVQLKFHSRYPEGDPFLLIIITLKYKLFQVKGIYLVGHTSQGITGNKLPSNCQLLSLLFYHHIDLKKTIKNLQLP